MNAKPTKHLEDAQKGYVEDITKACEAVISDHNYFKVSPFLGASVGVGVVAIFGLSWPWFVLLVPMCAFIALYRSLDNSTQIDLPSMPTEKSIALKGWRVSKI